MLDACIVGSAKAGTTSFAEMLSQHPDVDFSSIKEPHYFWPDANEFCGPSDDAWKSNIPRSEQSYWELFLDSGLKMEASGYISSIESLTMLYKHNPDMKIILILRDPVERALSAYRHLIRDGYEPLSFLAALESENERYGKNWGPLYWYRRLSDYKIQIKNMLNIFSVNNVCFILFEEMIDHPMQTVREVEDFLGIKHAQLNFPCMNPGTALNKDGSSRGLVSFLSIAGHISRLLLPKSVSSHFGKKALVYLNKNHMEKIRVDDELTGLWNDLYEDMPVIEKLTGLPCAKYWRGRVKDEIRFK